MKGSQNSTIQLRNAAIRKLPSSHDTRGTVQCVAADDSAAACVAQQQKDKVISGSVVSCREAACMHACVGGCGQADSTPRPPCFLLSGAGEMWSRIATKRENKTRNETRLRGKKETRNGWKESRSGVQTRAPQPRTVLDLRDSPTKCRRQSDARLAFHGICSPVFALSCLLGLTLAP
ncbi:hypothetical protein IWX47DRAFT_528470 [Phyllosticta citricarpa]